MNHVDDFTLARDDTLLKIVIEGIQTYMNVSKMQVNKFRFAVLDVKRHPDGISISIDDYIDILAQIKKIRKASGTNDLTKLKLK